MNLRETVLHFAEENTAKLLPGEAVEKEVHHVRQVREDVLNDARVEAEFVDVNVSVADVDAVPVDEKLPGIVDFAEEKHQRIRNIE